MIPSSLDRSIVVKLSVDNYIWWTEVIDHFYNKSISFVLQLTADFSAQQRMARVKVSTLSKDISLVAFLFYTEAEDDGGS